MKASESTLVEFIQDFHFAMTGSAIFFNADIEFATGSIFKKFNCEVHIIILTEKQLNVVYLLHPLLSQNGIPDIFSINADNFSYIKKKSLVISDYDLLRGKYSLTVSPLVITVSKKIGNAPGLNLIDEN